MKKNLLLFVVALLVITTSFAQLSTTPEVPRNYKPKAKDLLPMPDSLINEKIFPILGAYKVVNKKGDSLHVQVTADEMSKGVVWVSGLPEGKFKANLQASPAIYKIPAQKTYLNDKITETYSDAALTANREIAVKKTSGKSVEEGTMIYDQDARQLYINFGTKYNERNPATVFSSLMTSGIAEDVSSDTSAPAKKTKKAVTKGINYTGNKINYDSFVGSE